MSPKNDAPEQGETPGQASNPSAAVAAEGATPVEILRAAQNLIGGGNITGARDHIELAITALEAKPAKKTARKSARKAARKGGKRK